MLTKALIQLWGSPISGALRDWTGNYNLAFYTAGCALSIGGFINTIVSGITTKAATMDSNSIN